MKRSESLFSQTPILLLIVILIVAAAWRIWLIRTDAVALSSDEAVVGLMARHIAEGKPIPTFYYGQAYMGSLDAIFVAGGFRLFGESLRTIRYVQMILYLCAIVVAYLLALEITKKQSIALITALLMSIPNIMGTTYTTLTLGGYNEIVLLSNLVLLLGWQVTVGQSQIAWKWFLPGLAMGIGWWVNGAIATSIMVVGLMGLYHFSWQNRSRYLLAAIAFFIGSAPWWMYNFQHNWAAVKFLTDYTPPPDAPTLNLLEKLVGFFLLGFSTLYGFRFPWEFKFQVSLLPGLALIVYMVLLTDFLMAIYGYVRYKRRPVAFHVTAWVLFTFLCFTLIFMPSHFVDSTGRYFLPIWVPSLIGVATGLTRLKRAHSLIPGVALAIILTFHAGTVFRAVSSEYGLESQLLEHLRTHVEDDEALITFLDEHDYHYGYTSYWVSYRIMFRTKEEFIFDTSLPYTEYDTLIKNRYPPYVDAVAQAGRVVWITHQFPDFDRLIDRRLTEAGIAYQIEQIGAYRVYYDFSERIAPADFDLNSKQSLKKLLSEDSSP